MRSLTIGQLFLFALVPIRLMRKPRIFRESSPIPRASPFPMRRSSFKGPGNRCYPRSPLQPARLIQRTRAPARLL